MQHKTLILGHRGTISKPENTLSAFKKAIEAGADGVELDIQKTSDGVIVVSHDENLKRTAGIDFDIRKNTYDELKKISIEGEKVPTLSEVLDFIFGENKIVDIELKNPNDLSSLVGLLKKTKLGDFYISSFYHNVIFTAKKEFPEFKFGYIYEHIPAHMEDFSNEVDFLKPEINFFNFELYKNYTYKTIPWTVNSTSLLEELEKANVYAVITDVPEKLVKKDKTEENPLFLLFTSMIVKDSVNIAGNQIEFELRNKFQDLFIEEFSIENGKIEIEDKTLPFNFGVSETVKLKITLSNMGEAKLIIKTRETGELEFKLTTIIDALK